MNLSRRTFITTTALSATGLALGAGVDTVPSKSPAGRPRVKLGISTYSY